MARMATGCAAKLLYRRLHRLNFHLEIPTECDKNILFMRLRRQLSKVFYNLKLCQKK